MSKSKTSVVQPSNKKRSTPDAYMQDGIVAAYRPDGDSARWLRFFIKHDRHYQILLWTSLFIFLPLTFGVLSGVTTAAAYAAGVSYSDILMIMFHPAAVICMTPLTGIFAWRLAKILFQPTHLLCNDDGVWLHWQQRLGRPSRKLISWEDVERIQIRQEETDASKEKRMIILISKDKKEVLNALAKVDRIANKLRNKEASISNNDVFVRMSGLVELDGKDKLMRAFQRWVPEVPRDAEVVAALRSAEDHSYTEMWLTALSGPPTRERQAPLPPDTVLRDGKFKVISKLASGGQGTAYICTNLDKADPKFPLLQDRETVVLKEYVLPVHVVRSAKKQSIEDLQKEARILQQLNNPRVVKLLDFFVEDYRGYLVLEHISGKNLRKYVEANGPLDEESTKALGIQMCSILSYLHSQQPAIIHRDFTPENLILDENNILKLIDFNVAKISEDTFTATVVGKHAYLPPEQFRGKARTESDIYALGGTLFFLLTGQDPEPLSMSHPRESNPNISVEMDLIVSTCTSIDFKARYACAQDLRDALEASTTAHNDEPIS